MPWRESPAELARARVERPVRVPAPDGHLFGIYTPPDPAAPPAGVCAVLFSSPRSHRNRMWVEAARRLAAEGFSAFRVDFHGTGDSEGETGYRDPGKPYREDAAAVLRHLREAFGETRFVLYGICFDARTALAAFMDEPGAIEGVLFVAAPVTELDALVAADADRKGWRHLLFRALRNASPGGAPELPLSPSFVTHFQAFARSRARALFLYGQEDAEYETLRIAERRLFARLDPAVRARMTVEAWPGKVHGYLEIGRQRETLERCIEWIRGFHPAAARGAGSGRP
jgi:alpha/beta superfamily hydrolase